MMLAASFEPESTDALRFKPFITASTKEELDKMTLRDKYISEHLFDVGDIVDDTDSNITGVIIRRGTNYVTLEDVDMKLHKAWLYNIMETPVYPVKLEERARRLKEEIDQPKDKGLKDSNELAGFKVKTKASKNTKRFKEIYGELKTKRDKNEKEPQHRGNEFVPDNMPGLSFTDQVPESYEIGHDYAKYTSSITPGEKHYNPKFQGGPYKPSKHSDNLINVNANKDNEMKSKVELKDIEEWASSKETIDKYKERYGEEWKSKIEEIYNKMFNKVIDTSGNMLEGRMKDIAIDLKSKEEGGLDPEIFKRKYGKSKADMQRDLGTPPGGVKKSFKEFWAQSESKNEQV